jgi:hypothetical protein
VGKFRKIVAAVAACSSARELCVLAWVNSAKSLRPLPRARARVGCVCASVGKFRKFVAAVAGWRPLAGDWKPKANYAAHHPATDHFLHERFRLDRCSYTGLFLVGDGIVQVAIIGATCLLLVATGTFSLKRALSTCLLSCVQCFTTRAGNHLVVLGVLIVRSSLLSLARTGLPLTRRIDNDFFGKWDLIK